MKIIAHTPYGVFEGKEITEEQDEVEQLLSNIHKLSYFCFYLPDNSMVYFTKGMIDETLFILKSEFESD